jgi:mannose-1-phosphate guanylyltransferase
VNAGTYLLDPAVLRSWTADRSISIEREIFPDVIAAGHPVFGFPGECYWMDLGTPEKYLQAHRDILAGQVRGLDYEAPWIAADADVEAGASIGPRCAIGSEARVADGAGIQDSVLHPGASVAAGARVRDSIVGAGAHVGVGADVRGCVLGAGSRVPDGMAIADLKVPTDAEATLA